MAKDEYTEAACVQSTPSTYSDAEWALEAAESTGAAGYALMGVAGLVFASVYLKNFLPLGTPAMLLSAGMMPLNSIAVGLEVAGAFLLMWTEFLDQALFVERGSLTAS